MDIRDYARYVLNNDNTVRKRQLMGLFNFQLYLHNKKLISSMIKRIS